MPNETQMRQSTSMGVSTSTGSAPQASLSKYAKIQPAIAIKPKPTLAFPPAKSTFNPRYNPAKPAALAQDDTLANINTLRKWVLPPRPRPGRKPTAQQTSTLSPPEKTATKKKMKVLRRDDADRATGALSPAGAGPPAAYAASQPTATPLRRAGSAPVSATAADAASPLAGHAPAVPKQVEDLQLTYLARLKEQELIRNYIEVLTNQIKELRFVQSGVITFDALNTGSKLTPKAPVLLPAEQLDHINNIRDLDKHLAHLTTQLNVIHSVTKKFLGDSLAPQGSHLQLQIKHYLDLLAKHRGGNASMRPLVLPQLRTAPTPLASSLFTPSLLRPLKMNLFEQEDEVIDVDIINDSDSFLHDKLRMDTQPADDFLNLSPELKQAPTPLKGKKMGCGFCSGDTPCLCFDADSVFGER